MSPAEELEDTVLHARDVAANWVSPHAKPQCDCHEKSPTWPVARDRYHLEPCPYFYLEKMGEYIDLQAKRIAELEAEVRFLRSGPAAQMAERAEQHLPQILLRLGIAARWYKRMRGSDAS